MFLLSKLLLMLCEDGMEEQWVQDGLPSGEGETGIVEVLKTYWAPKRQLSEPQRSRVTRTYTLVPTIEWSGGQVFLFEFSIGLCSQHRRKGNGETMRVPAAERDVRRGDVEMAVSVWGDRTSVGPGVWFAAADFPQLRDQEENPPLMEAAPQTTERSFECQLSILGWGQGEVGNQS